MNIIISTVGPLKEQWALGSCPGCPPPLNPALYTCRCKKTGHVAAMCRYKRQEKFGQSSMELWRLGKEDVGESRDEEGEVVTIPLVKRNSRKPFVVDTCMIIHGISVTMETDTGAAVSLISQKTLRPKLQGYHCYLA